MDNAIFNKVEFKGAVEKAQLKKNGEVTIQLTADIDDIDMNTLSLVMDSNGGVQIKLEGNQTELVGEDEEENDDQLDLLGEEGEKDE
ncbi:hypothetical protein DN438_03200 [Lactobacillus reuteri]|uniref:hypothetical protein n=1 Tax=Limosilactobacillus reuteri TaxID=1598 RepID=UPI00128B52D3|nr:hypothetical protein [Limosilactobacillus reuteri]MQB67110.1 hypothetical protein [Limosilactobacillus reuteri]